MDSALTNDCSNFTFDLNAGIFFPTVSDVFSLTSKSWASKIAQRELEKVFDEAEPNDVSLSSDIKLKAHIDYGRNSKNSGHWLNGEYNEVGVTARVEIISGGMRIDKIGPVQPKGLNFTDLSGFKIDIPIYTLPFNSVTSVHFSNAYSMVSRNRF